MRLEVLCGSCVVSRPGGRCPSEQIQQLVWVYGRFSKSSKDQELDVSWTSPTLTMYPSHDVDLHARGKQFDACLLNFVGLIRGSYYGKLLSELAWNRMETVKKIEVPCGSSVVCLNLEEDAQVNRDTSGNSLTFEDRTTHFFPPAPRVPRMPGLAPGNWFN